MKAKNDAIWLKKIFCVIKKNNISGQLLNNLNKLNK
jgi:hypothetical protein